MRISDWSSDVCSSDLLLNFPVPHNPNLAKNANTISAKEYDQRKGHLRTFRGQIFNVVLQWVIYGTLKSRETIPRRSEEHTSELQSLMRISYAVFCLKKKTNYKDRTIRTEHKPNKQA